jgi:trimeric autotransporter adhesin
VWSFTPQVLSGGSGPPLIAAPTLLSPLNGLAGASTQVTLQWSAVTGASGYWLQVASDSAFTNLVISRDGITTTQLTMSNLTSGMTYWWRVGSWNAAGQRSAFSAAWRFTGVGKPTLLSPTDTAIISGPITLQWSAVPGATGYRVQVATDYPFANITVNLTTANTFATLPPLPLGKQYWWRVRVEGAGGTQIGEFTAPWRFSIP